MLLDRPDLAARVLTAEKDAGRRAAFHVYYQTKAGKKMVDAFFKENFEVPSVEAAEAFVTKYSRGSRIIGTVIPTGDL